MIRCGLSSATYRNKDAATVIRLAVSAGLEGLEWTADTHAPQGDFKRADELMMATLRAGLTISSYGSFVRISAECERTALALATAKRLNAPLIRAWAAPGCKGDSSAKNREDLRSAWLKAADLTGKDGITLCIEPHPGSQIPSLADAARLVESAEHPFLMTCWTPPTGGDPQELASKQHLLALVRVRAWTESFDRLALADGDAWQTAVRGLSEEAQRESLDRWAILEYLEDEDEGTLKREAETLLSVARGDKT